MTFDGFTDEEAQAIVAGIVGVWSGEFGGFDVSVRLDVLDAPIFAVYKTTLLKEGAAGAGGSRGRGRGAEIRIHPDLSPGLLGGVAAHEFGHGMTLGHSLFARNVMSPTYKGGSAVSKSQIRKAIRRCAEESRREATSTDEGADK